MKKFVFLGVFLYFVSISVEAEVEVYGVLDVAIGTVAHQYGQDPNYSQSVNAINPTPAPHSLTGMFNGGLQNSLWGIKGTEEKADGQQVMYKFEIRPVVIPVVNMQHRIGRQFLQLTIPLLITALLRQVCVISFNCPTNRHPVRGPRKYWLASAAPISSTGLVLCEVWWFRHQ